MKAKEEIKRLYNETLQTIEQLKNSGSEVGVHKYKAIADVYAKVLGILDKEPKFKVGDTITPIDSVLGGPRSIISIHEGFYETSKGVLDMEFEDNWKLDESDLDEASNMYVGHSPEPGEDLSAYSNRQAFKAGAKWKEQQDRKWMTDNNVRIYNDGWSEGFEAGRDDMSDQINDEAIEAEVQSEGCFIPLISVKDKDKVKDISFGDKIKILIIKQQ